MVRIALVWLLLMIPTESVASQERWNQFGGPRRNFHAPDASLAPSWPEQGPPVVWRRELGDGYSCILVEGDRLFTMYRRDGKEVVVALDRSTGATVWEHAYPVAITSSARQFGGGPSATPALAGDRLVTIGVGMHLHCLDKASGKVLWRRSLMDDFKLPMPGRGYSPSPLIYRDTVILPIGGTDPVKAEDDGGINGVKNGAVMGFDLATGKTVWAQHDFPDAKASPLLIEFVGAELLVVFMGNELAALDPSNGDLIWRHDHPTSYGFNCATPVYDGVDTLVCSSAYNNWTQAVRLVEKEGKIGAELRWASRRLRVHFTNLVLVDGRVYGSNGMGRPAFLTCLDVESGSAMWRERGFAKANLVHGDGRLVILDEDGLLSLATPTDDGLEIGGQLQISEGYAFSAPTLVGNRLYVRDRKFLTVFNVGPDAMTGKREEGATFALERPELPDDIEQRLGRYQTDSSGLEPSRIRLLVEEGWLKLDLPRQQRVRLAPKKGTGRWEFMEDRTSGSTPRWIEFLDGEEGAFVLWSPRQEKRTYRMRGK